MSYIKKSKVLAPCTGANLRTVDSAPVTIVGVEAIHAKATRDAVVNARPKRNGTDGRSQWFQFALSNGDVIFGCFPQGANLAAVEADSRA